MSTAARNGLIGGVTIFAVLTGYYALALWYQEPKAKQGPLAKWAESVALPSEPEGIPADHRPYLQAASQAVIDMGILQARVLEQMNSGTGPDKQLWRDINSGELRESYIQTYLEGVGLQVDEIASRLADAGAAPSDLEEFDEAIEASFAAQRDLLTNRADFLVISRATRGGSMGRSHLDRSLISSESQAALDLTQVTRDAWGLLEELYDPGWSDPVRDALFAQLQALDIYEFGSVFEYHERLDPPGGNPPASGG